MYVLGSYAQHFVCSEGIKPNIVLVNWYCHTVFLEPEWMSVSMIRALPIRHSLPLLKESRDTQLVMSQLCCVLYSADHIILNCPTVVTGTPRSISWSLLKKTLSPSRIWQESVVDGDITGKQKFLNQIIYLADGTTQDMNLIWESENQTILYHELQ